jgi:hypothetical protein
MAKRKVSKKKPRKPLSKKSAENMESESSAERFCSINTARQQNDDESLRVFQQA